MQEGGQLPRGQIQLHLKKLKLLGVQARLRAQIEKEQNDINQMQDKLYRKFVRSCHSNFSTFDKVVSAFANSALQSYDLFAQMCILTKREPQAMNRGLKWASKLSRPAKSSM